MFESDERRYLERARVARLATADGDARPSVVPICFALAGTDLVSAVDEKPMDVPPADLTRVRHVRENPRVALVADHYDEDWSRLGWVRVRGTARVVEPADEGHDDAVAALRSKYDQYAEHDLESRPLLWIEAGSVVSWGRLARDRTE